jgi:hypothetical protein
LLILNQFQSQSCKLWCSKVDTTVYSEALTYILIYQG